MMMKLLILAALACQAETFAVVPGTSNRVRTSVLLSESHDDVLDRIQGEYKELQNLLFEDILVKHDAVKAEEVAEKMIEKAVDATAVKRFEQLEVMEQAQADKLKAQGDFERAKDIKRRVHDEARAAKQEAAMMESALDAQHDEMERLRDMSVVHADQQLEVDAELLGMKSALEEEKAEKKLEGAAFLLKKLQYQEASLKRSLDEMRSLKNQEFINNWKMKQAAKHEKLLNQIKASIDDDPYLAQKSRSYMSFSKDPYFSKKEEIEHESQVKEWKNKEDHRHDSLLNEIEHAIDNDPDLA